MAAELPLVFAVSCEDNAHYEAVSTLTDRVLTDRVEWLRDQLPHCRIWHQADPHRPWFSFRHALIDARPLKLRVHGHFDDAPGMLDARRARTQLLLWKQLRDQGTRLDVVIIARDLDHKEDGHGGLDQAIGASPWPFTVLVAWFQPEAEAWFIGGFEPRTPAERDLLAKYRQKLGFCPVQQAHRLLSTRDDSKKDAKVVCAALTEDDRQRRSQCLQTHLAILRKHGEHTGLRDFLDQLDARVVPLFSAGPTR